MRMLFWIALALLVYFVVRSKWRALRHRQQQEQQEQARRQTEALESGEPMASCAHCHMYFPASEAVHAEGLEYCSSAHARLPPPR